VAGTAERQATAAGVVLVTLCAGQFLMMLDRLSIFELGDLSTASGLCFPADHAGT